MWISISLDFALYLYFIIIVCVLVCAWCVCKGTYTMGLMGRSEENFLESLLPLLNWFQWWNSCQACVITSLPAYKPALTLCFYLASIILSLLTLGSFLPKSAFPYFILPPLMASVFIVFIPFSNFMSHIFIFIT